VVADYVRIPFHSWMCGIQPTIRIPTTVARTPGPHSQRQQPGVRAPIVSVTCATLATHRQWLKDRGQERGAGRQAEEGAQGGAGVQAPGPLEGPQAGGEGRCHGHGAGAACELGPQPARTTPTTMIGPHQLQLQFPHVWARANTANTLERQVLFVAQTGFQEPRKGNRVADT
jgi:hypothetical protein